jgi:P2-related tail formation protein
MSARREVGMDPLSLILTAVAAGASAALKESAADVVKGAYEKLRGLLRAKLGGRPRGEMVLEAYEEDPDSAEKLFGKELRESGADADEQIIEAAKELADLVAPEASRSYTMNVQNLGPVSRQINIQHAENVGFDDDPGH